MKVCNLLVIVICVFLGYSCTDRKQIDLISYQNSIDSMRTQYYDSLTGEYVVDLCTLFNKTEWDSIVVVVPYTSISTLEGLGLCNLYLLRDTLDDMVDVEWNYGLLFTKGNCITSYSIVGANIGFNTIAGYTQRLMPIVKRRDCQVRLITVDVNGNKSFLFNPLHPSPEDLKIEEKVNRYLREHN